MYRFSLTKKSRVVNRQIAWRVTDAALSSTYISKETRAEAARLKAADDVAAAVKAVRERTTLDLLEAKQYVDKL